MSGIGPALKLLRPYEGETLYAAARQAVIKVALREGPLEALLRASIIADAFSDVVLARALREAS